jgi:hypothetical protein
METLGRGSLWLRHAFLLPTSDDMTSYGSATKRRYANSAAFKFTNTTLGGNWAINNPPQFTRYADIRQPGRGRTEASRAQGMGRYYSEAIDDPAQVIHMSFGVPQFSSWSSFFSNFYDRNAAMLANTGRVSGLWYNAGFIGGMVVTLPLQPFIIGVSAVKRVYNFLAKNSPSKWYYFKPTMHAYWSSVNTIANELAVGLGLVPRVLAPSQFNYSNDGEKPKTDPGQDVNAKVISEMNRLFPDIFREDGGIDVMALSTRTQRISDASQQAMEKMQQNAENAQELREAISKYVTDKVADPDPDMNARRYFEEYLKVDQGDTEGLGTTESISSWKDLSVKGVYDFMKAHQRDGSQFATFRVNHNGSMSESFTNSTRDSEIAQTLNSKVAQGRQASMSFMSGNITDVIGDVMNSFQSFVAGGLDSVSLGGLATLAGTAFIDIPKMWDSSTAQLPRAEYTIPLVSPYGNKISRFINMYVPLAMVMAGSLPRSAGRSAYTSPFICQVYHQGRVQCQLGMVESMTLTRGTGNVGWNADHDMLGAELTISVVDLSSILHIPIKSGFTTGNWTADAASAAATLAAEGMGGDTAAALTQAATNDQVWDEQSLFSDYMAVLTSLPISDTYYVKNRLNLNMTQALQSFKNWRSPSNFLSMAMDTAPVRAISAFAQTSNRF